ncbi:hypothetical protein SUDANB70_00633 [Streptomyces sp. enrichment culture]
MFTVYMSDGPARTPTSQGSRGTPDHPLGRDGQGSDAGRAAELATVRGRHRGRPGAQDLTSSWKSKVYREAR